MRFAYLTLLALGCAALAPVQASAEVVFSAYGGIQGAFDSHVSSNDPAPRGAGKFEFDQRWKGNSFKSPLYWAVRGTWWIEQMPGWGVSLDYTHTKVYADPLPDGWTTLELTDGLNVLTATALYRFQKDDRSWTPYVGAGVGISVACRGSDQSQCAENLRISARGRSVPVAGRH
jgi:lipid A oxidase